MKLLHSPLDLQTFLKRKNVIIKSCRPCTLNYVLIHLSSV